jgi:hypothetical protein
MLRIGLCLGLALPALIRAIVEARKKVENKEDNDKELWSNLLELYLGLFLAVAFLLLFGGNMYIWTRAHINYKFIFEFDTRSNLDFRQYLEVCINRKFIHIS